MSITVTSGGFIYFISFFFAEIEIGHLRKAEFIDEFPEVFPQSCGVVFVFGEDIFGNIVETIIE